MEHHFWNVSWLGLEFHMDTLIMVWGVMLVVLAWAFLSTRKLSVVPSTAQSVAETAYDFCRSITMATAGPRGDRFLFYVGSLFIFIWLANLAGQLHLLKWVHLPGGAHLSAPTGDFNVPLALALCTLILYFFIGISIKGLGYFKHYVSPDPWYIGIFFFPLNVLEDLTRPGSLMIRLYFNILVGHILMGIAQAMIPHVLPVAVIFLEIFVATVQAYIFAILSSVYISLMSAEHH